MKKGETIYCIDESLYSDHITKRKSYRIEDAKLDQIRIPNDRQKLVWLPSHCFTDSIIPDIKSINIDDEINDNYNSCVEVTIKFSDGTKRWGTFMTINRLNKLFNNHRHYFTGNNLIFTQQINKDIIERTIMELDKQNELYKNTNEY